ncbi:hypothetical protein FAM09_06565 [Niastella caeni]|uniref:YfhO family protein n=1 Tax=Niastella caeni TaxID=2569763 RepID=A0A4S8I0T4_9BACT|nr:hypothetical protein [Niastella caeni]THU41758.1 hypothetical protein FAM09_06565 [Niastella caeni]
MNNKLLQYGLPVLILLVIFYPLFHANYVYLDDIHQLWYNEKGATYNIWLIHGRFLAGHLMEKAFTSINTIDAVKSYRILSVIGWALAICVYVKVATQWVRYKLMDSRMVLLSAVYIACSLSVAIANGWGGTCFEIFMTFTAGLLGGHLLYTQLKKHNRYRAIPIPMQLLILALGVTALFTYQIGIGLFLIPFFLHFNSRKFEKPDHIIITGVIAMLVITLVYYLLFKLLLNTQGEEEGHRASLNLNILSKISFFFGVPTAQAFSFNFLFNLHSIISQAFYIIAIAVWVVYSFATQRDKPVINKIIYLAGSFALLMLIYLPVMVTIENYSSYRSMLALNLAVFLMFTNMILEWIKNVSRKNYFAVAAMIVFAGVGFYNFRYNFLKPILKEYQAVRAYVEKNYKPGITKVNFLRPPEGLFYKQFHVRYYRDEFGLPSTHKDWVPENLVKQIIYEMTHDKNIARKIEVVQFAEAEPFKQQVALKEANTLSIDVEAIFNSN